jgi:tetratricopeptide (TPR) repeat protein
LTERARLALHRNEAADAEAWARRALAAAPTDVLAWQVLSNALHAQGRADEAARALDNHIYFDGAAAALKYLGGELDERPDDPDVLARVAAAYLRLRETARAEAFVSRALSLDPNHAPSRALLQQLQGGDRFAP